MIALKLGGIARIINIEKDIRVIEHALGCARGCVETLWTQACDAVIACDREAQQHGAPYNQIASLIAGQGIYGAAIIMGDGNDDVPERYINMMAEIEE